jgi:hypothetical protein
MTTKGKVGETLTKMKVGRKREQEDIVLIRFKIAEAREEDSRVDKRERRPQKEDEAEGS